MVSDNKYLSMIICGFLEIRIAFRFRENAIGRPQSIEDVIVHYPCWNVVKYTLGSSFLATENIVAENNFIICGVRKTNPYLRCSSSFVPLTDERARATIRRIVFLDSPIQNFAIYTCRSLEILRSIRFCGHAGWACGHSTEGASNVTEHFVFFSATIGKFNN